MKILLLISTLFLSHILFAKTNQYGAKFSEVKGISLKNALKTDSTGEVVIQAKVGAVCQTKGCWMMLENEKKDVRVKFKDYKFFVPFSLVGKNVLIRGKIEKKIISKEEAEHLAKDAGKKNHKVSGPKLEYRIIASGVKVI